MSKGRIYGWKRTPRPDELREPYRPRLKRDGKVRIGDYELTLLRDQDNREWFVGLELGGLLGYTDAPRAVRRHCDGSVLLSSVEAKELGLNSRGCNVVPKEDLLKLTMKSTKPVANDILNYLIDGIAAENKPNNIEEEEKDMPRPEHIEELSPDYTRLTEANTVQTSATGTVKEDNTLTVGSNRKFDFKGSDLTVLTDPDGNVWLVAKEVCDVLGLEPRDSVRYLDDDEKSYVSRIHIGYAPGKDMLSINESGLYSLILRSRKPEAKAFKKWVTSEVLPEIRKTGGYGKAPKELTREEILKMALEAEEERKQLAHDLKVQQSRTTAALAMKKEAERTKSHISKGIVQTAMSTASIEKRKRLALENKIGEGKLWKKLINIDWIDNYFPSDRGTRSLVGKELVELSNVFKMPARTVDDEQWGTVKSYHIRVINKFKHLLDSDPQYLSKLRRPLH